MTLCGTQSAKAQVTTVSDDSAAVQKRLTLKEKIRIADSLRLRMRNAADNGRMLQWADTLLREKLRKGEIDEAKYRRRMKRLEKYDKRLYGFDSLFAEKYKRKSFDTLYMSRPQERWTFKLRTNVSGAKLVTLGQYNGQPHEMEVKADCRATLSAGVSYRGISFGLSLNPGKLAGKNKDYELNINSYGNRMGFDIVYMESATYHGSQSFGGESIGIDKGDVEQRALNLNFYYAFNGRRFSFPAAFSQSYIQRRSAGSWMIGASADVQQTDIHASESALGGDATIKLTEVAVGGGYGFNYVPSSRWLIHLSSLPTLIVVSHDNVTFAGQRLTMKYDFPRVIITGRGAATYSWGNKFAGVAMVYNSSVTGSDDRLQVKRDKWRLRFFWGFRW